MLETRALIRANWLTMTSYRLQTLLRLGGLVVSLVPLYFIADALQPVMADSIRSEGERFFGFLIVGTIALYFVHASVQQLPGAIRGGINMGMLEALLSTPARLPAVLAGLIGASFIFVSVRSLILLVAGWLLGGGVHLGALIPATGILVLIVLAYLPFGIISAALVLVFRTAGPVPQAVTYVSTLLGGVYYPTHVIPSWIQDVSNLVPLTYGLRALRRVLLENAPLERIAADVGILAGFAAGLFIVSGVAFSLAFRYAKRTGTLAQY